MLTSLTKDDEKQALRIKRFFFAVASYIMGITLTAFCYAIGLTQVPLRIMISTYILIVISNVIIFFIFKTGLNKRFKDPSLTLFQMVLATIWIMVAAFYGDEVRGSVLLLYLVIFIFGLFQLRYLQFLFISAFAVISYAVVIFLLIQYRPETANIKVELTYIIVLMTVLLWFSFIGGYISTLRIKIAKALETIEKLAIYDDLTQVYNRRQMYKLLEEQKALADRGVHPFSLCIFDLDRFKKINDTHGHEKGDIVLKTIAQAVQKSLRDYDYIARYGGEEFVLILTNTDKDEAIVCAERVRKLIENIAIEGIPESFGITISIGIAKYEPVESVQDVINRADTAMYKAKDLGRNKVEYMSDIN